MSLLHDLPTEPAAARRLRAVADPEPLDFDAAVRRLGPRLQRFAARRLGDPHEAQEVVQEALLRAFHHRAELATEDDLAAWCTCVTGRLVIDRLRVRGRSVHVADVPEGSRTGRDTAEVVVGREQARLALDALDAMPSRQAAVLWAREVEGLSYEQMAQRFAMTEPAVRSTLARARKALRREFATRGGTLPAAGLVALAPWASGLGPLERLRRVVTRLTGPATLGVAGLGVLGGVLTAPWTGPAPVPAPSTTLGIRSVTATERPAEAAPAQDAPGAAPRVPTPPRKAPVIARTPAPASRDTALTAARLNDVCVASATAQAGAGGRACAPAPTTAIEVVTVPDNPTGVTTVVLSSDTVDCAWLPSPELAAAVPRPRCTTQPTHRPAASGESR